MSGLSEVWYQHIGLNEHLYEIPHREITEALSPLQRVQLRSSLSDACASAICSAFAWEDRHGDQQPIGTPQGARSVESSQDCGACQVSEDEDSGWAQEGGIETTPSLVAREGGVIVDNAVFEDADPKREPAGIKNQETYVGGELINRYPNNNAARVSSVREDPGGALGGKVNNGVAGGSKAVQDEYDLEPWTSSLQNAVFLAADSYADGVPMDGVQLTQPTGTEELKGGTDEDKVTDEEDEVMGEEEYTVPGT